MPINPSTLPALQVWNRLEPRPRKQNFDRALRAEIRDALWMITRQWQFGELNAEDTGSAVFSRVEMETSQLTRFSKKTAAGGTAYNPNTPMEAEVEKRPANPDLMLRLDLGRQFLRMLSDAIASTVTYNALALELKTAPALQYLVPSTPGAGDAPLFSNPELLQTTLAVSANAIDGHKLYTFLKTGANTVSMLLSAANATADTTGTAFVQWYERVYSQPADAADTAWNESHLEYQFACAAPKSASAYTVMTAKEYYQGHLDWYSVDIEKDTTKYDSSITTPAPDTSKIKREQFTVFPSPLAFGGMPAPRYWEMEDRQINFGSITATTTDTARLLLAEFGLIYGNDWSLLPYTVPVGSICEVKNIVVTDVFGQKTIVAAAGAGSNDDWTRWAMYTLHQNGPGASKADTRLFIPPVVDKLQESEPVESITMARDEMANMVWGVENTISDGISSSEKGFEAAQRYKAYLESLFPATVTPPAVTNTAAIKYNIQSAVPDNWIPFVPVRLGSTIYSRAIQLQRAAMPRVMGALTERIRPRTQLLSPGLAGSTWNPYYIFEEEVPRSGAVVSTSWQRARWNNGKVVLWLGNRKQNGRGEGNSGLKFDYLTGK
jgi:hypothetical protein